MQPVVIYDGECDFCRTCMLWIGNRTKVTGLAFQDINPEKYGVTKEQCSQSVIVVSDQIYFGADAVALLLNNAGNSLMARFIRLSGNFGKKAYKYIANNRNGILVKLIHEVLKKTL